MLVAALLLFAASLVAGGFVSGQAQAAPRPTTGFADPLFASADAGERQLWLSRAKAAGSKLVRIGVNWRSVAGGSEPLQPRNPADVSYDFGRIDAAVRDARARGLGVILTITDAPGWAEGSNRPRSAPVGSWKPSPAKFGDFGHAVAQRYSGSFGGLPRVDYLQAWNEPNLESYLTPQYKGKRNQSASRYKRMLNGFYSGVKSTGSGAQVITAGTAPFGDRPGGDRTRPLTFWRKVLCVEDGRKKPRAKRCPNKPRFDVLAHHPINTTGGPGRSASNPNDATTADFGKVRRILRAAERGDNVAGGRHPLWATELWWDTKPPSRFGITPRRQAKYLKRALASLARQGARVVINLRVRDTRESRRGRQFGSASGLYFPSGKKKPSLGAWRAGSR